MPRRRRCATCPELLPADARATQKYCGASCRPRKPKPAAVKKPAAARAKPKTTKPAAKVRTLRSVAPDEKLPPPAKTKPKTVTQAADTGTTRELLVAMRARIAKAVESENTPARDLAALTKRLVEVVRDIEAIDAREEQEATRGNDVADEAFDETAI